MVQPDNLAKWQTVKTYVTRLTEAPPRLGYRVREGTKVGPREWIRLSSSPSSSQVAHSASR